ncbi:replication initiation protein [Cohaesibacter gelatinilyticus]|uniref:Penicillin-insensitive murein endopeptidase n=1 Tax=Cohaesibacter gelatinilyticus TaxID=372072 RepID=A0A285NFG9_9HYPH|nr:replication initiation protein [Cohaesibacter gelatinilyticus]SNZ08195.1 penicillin-insensitive murein endopeptidase [Cohaesibacter gelatinilyticus]
MRILKFFLVAIVIALVALIACFPSLRSYAVWLVTQPNQGQSQCFGSVKSGRLAYGIHLPFSGENFRAYSFPGWLIGRANAHTKVRDIVLATYQALSTSHPDLKFTFGEISWPWGGKLWPHVTHRNGEAVDFFVPVIDKRSGKSDFFPSSLFNKLGYNFEFDAKGRSSVYDIDFAGLAVFLHELRKQAAIAGAPVQLVIFAPELQQFLFRTSEGADLSSILRFSRKRSWVRHDEHIHVVFDLPCKRG